MIDKPSCPTPTRRYGSLRKTHGVKYMKRVAKTKDFDEFRCGHCGYSVKVNFE